MNSVTDEDLSAFALRKETDEQRRRIMAQLDDPESYANRWLDALCAACRDPFDIDVRLILEVLDEEESETDGDAEGRHTFWQKVKRYLLNRLVLPNMLSAKFGFIEGDLRNCGHPDGRELAHKQLDKLTAWAVGVGLEERLVDRLFRLGKDYFESDRLEAAKMVLREVVILCRRFEDFDNRRRYLVYALLLLGTVEHFLFNLDLAEQHIRESLDSCEALYGSTTREYATAAFGLARVTEDQANYDAAKTLFRTALAYYESHGDSESSYARCLAGLARLEAASGNVAAASNLLTDALAHAERAGDILDTAIILVQLGQLHYIQGAHDSALAALQRAATLLLQKRRLRRGETYAVTLLHLGVVHLALEDFAAAEDILRESATIIRRMYNDTHPRFADALNNLALLEERKGNYNVAFEFHNLALAIRTQRLGDAHPLVALSLQNVACLHAKIGNFEEAEAAFNRASPFMLMLGEDHAAVQVTQENIRVLQTLRSEHPDTTVTLSSIPVRIGDGVHALTCIAA